MMLIFAGINQFSSSWIAAVMVQGAGQLIVTILIIQGYIGKLDFSTVMVPVFNFNFGLVIAAFLYYSSERQARYISFLKWSIEQVNFLLPFYVLQMHIHHILYAMLYYIIYCCCMYELRMNIICDKNFLCRS